MSGTNEKDYIISSQLMHEADDLYAKLTKYQPTTSAPEKVSSEELLNFWNPDPNFSTHNRDQGLHANLILMNKFAEKHGSKTSAITNTGTTVGECKLFTTLRTLVMIEPNVLERYEKLERFYEGFMEHEETMKVINSCTFHQYFVKGE